MTVLPDGFVPISTTSRFRFACHPEVPCFTECCRQLDLALTPYDVLRLKNRLKLHSGRFLEQYVIIEWDPSLLFPQCYLTMIDDGRASCVFVSPAGCTVYEDRPGACRAYPVGRGASAGRDGGVEETLVLVREPHCLGFREGPSQTTGEYFAGQGLDDYSRCNDTLLDVTQHQRIRNGFRPSRRQLDQFILALYNLDTFRQEFNDGRITLRRPLRADELQGLAGDDEQLLLLGIRWLRQELFDE
ncbi:MAG TPA: YkgJ family cysteine cluster protein [Desulfobacteraceae bacterium]|nr:YkgJ family cysteine cluster protein [Desulfobacteraceae bacterium]